MSTRYTNFFFLPLDLFLRGPSLERFFLFFFLSCLDCEVSVPSSVNLLSLCFSLFSLSLSLSLSPLFPGPIPLFSCSSLAGIEVPDSSDVDGAVVVEAVLDEVSEPVVEVASGVVVVGVVWVGAGATAVIVDGGGVVSERGMTREGGRRYEEDSERIDVRRLCKERERG